MVKLVGNCVHRFLTEGESWADHTGQKKSENRKIVKMKTDQTPNPWFSEHHTRLPVHVTILNHVHQFPGRSIPYWECFFIHETNWRQIPRNDEASMGVHSTRIAIDVSSKIICYLHRFEAMSEVTACVLPRRFSALILVPQSVAVMIICNLSRPDPLHDKKSNP